MSEAVIIAAFGVVAVAIGGLYALLFQHISHCNTVQTSLGEMKATLALLQREIGDHETGLRGSIHKLRSEITPYMIDEQRRRKE